MASISPLTTHRFNSVNVLVAHRDGQDWYVLYNVIKALNGSQPPNAVRERIRAALGPEHITAIMIQTPHRSGYAVRRAPCISETAVRFLAGQKKSITAEQFIQWLDAGYKLPEPTPKPNYTPAPSTAPTPRPVTYDHQGRVDLDAVRERIHPLRTRDSMFRFLNTKLIYTVREMLLTSTGVEPVVHMDDGTIYVSQPIADMYTRRLAGHKFKIRGNSKFSQVFECEPGSTKYNPMTPLIRADIPLHHTSTP